MNAVNRFNGFTVAIEIPELAAARLGNEQRRKNIKKNSYVDTACGHDQIFPYEKRWTSELSPLYKDFKFVNGMAFVVYALLSTCFQAAINAERGSHKAHEVNLCAVRMEVPQ